MIWTALALAVGGIAYLVQELRLRTAQGRITELADQATKAILERDRNARQRDALREDYTHAIQAIRSCSGDPGPLLDELLLDPWLGRPPAPGVG